MKIKIMKFKVRIKKIYICDNNNFKSIIASLIRKDDTHTLYMENWMIFTNVYLWFIIQLCH